MQRALRCFGVDFWGFQANIFEMDIEQFFVIIGAVVIGNIVCIFAAIAGWQLMKHSKEGGSDDTLPVKYYIAMIIPCLLVALAGYSL